MQKQHPFCSRKADRFPRRIATRLDPVEVDSARQVPGLEENRSVAGILDSVDKRGDFSTQQVVYLKNDVPLFRKGVPYSGGWVERVGVILFQYVLLRKISTKCGG